MCFNIHFEGQLLHFTILSYIFLNYDINVFYRISAAQGSSERMSKPCEFSGENEDRILARLGGTNTTNKIKTAKAQLLGQQMDHPLALHSFIDHFSLFCASKDFNKGGEGTLYRK